MVFRTVISIAYLTINPHRITDIFLSEGPHRPYVVFKRLDIIVAGDTVIETLAEGLKFIELRRTPVYGKFKPANYIPVGNRQSV